MAATTGRRGAGVWAAVVVLAGLLAACDGGPAATPARDHSASAPPGAYAERAPAAEAGAYGAGAYGAGADPRDAPAPQFQGRPLWSANRRATAEENAQAHFERNGAAFGAATMQAYVAKAHAFVSKPPKGVLTLSRPNGDTLFYDPAANVFAVATAEGAPRTMFKPDDGLAYWERQKDREARRAQNGAASADGANRDQAR